MASSQEKELLPVYLFIGEDKLKRENLLKRMRKRIAQTGELALNEAEFLASNVEPAGTVISACNTVPFLADKRLVVVKEIENARKELLDLLSDYVDAPMPTTVLVIVGEKLNKTTKLYKRCIKNYPKAFIACDLAKEKDIGAFIQKMVASANAEIETQAVYALVDRLGNSTVAISSEITKLCNYLAAQGRYIITLADVESMVSRVAVPKPWDLTDALSRRDVAKSLEVLNKMSTESPIGLMVLSVRRMRELLITKAVCNRVDGTSLDEVLGGHPYAHRNHQSFARNFKESELIDILDKAALAELKMKSGADQLATFEEWIIGVCSGVWVI